MRSVDISRLPSDRRCHGHRLVCEANCCWSTSYAFSRPILTTSARFTLRPFQFASSSSRLYSNATEYGGCFSSFQSIGSVAGRRANVEVSGERGDMWKFGHTGRPVDAAWIGGPASHAKVDIRKAASFKSREFLNKASMTEHALGPPLGYWRQLASHVSQTSRPCMLECVNERAAEWTLQNLQSGSRRSDSQSAEACPL